MDVTEEALWSAEPSQTTFEIVKESYIFAYYIFSQHVANLSAGARFTKKKTGVRGSLDFFDENPHANCFLATVWLSDEVKFL
jgi:hypothetical protein